MRFIERGITRRELLRGALGSAVAYAVPALWTRNAAAVDTAPVLVNIVLRGGVDGLSLVAPHGDSNYALLRPTIGLAPGATYDLDGFFGLHPSLGALEPLYRDGSLAIVHAVGSTDPTRSHFKAQDYLETAAPGQRNVTQGWMNRWLATESTVGRFAGVTIGPSRALSLQGAVETASFVSLDTSQAGDFLQEPRRVALEEGFRAGADAQIETAAEQMLAMSTDIAAISRTTTVVYPGTTFASELRDAAALIKASIGVRAVAIDLAGWDHHTEANTRLPIIAEDFSVALEAFHRDLGSHATRTLVLATTEFGRTAAENGGGGSDHGHGSVLFALGGGVRGGRVHLRGGHWPGLAPADLHEARDLAVTTDFRDVLAEVLRRHLGVADPGALPLGFVANPSNELGLFA
jgi:uncharacterized protein (DUF1501 family)